MAYRYQAIRVIRERRGLDIGALAVKAGISVRQLYYIEKGAEPKAKTLDRLAQALGVGVDKFFARSA